LLAAICDISRRHSFAAKIYSGFLGISLRIVGVLKPNILIYDEVLSSLRFFDRGWFGGCWFGPFKM
jgi:hypothetical protein